MAELHSFTVNLILFSLILISLLGFGIILQIDNPSLQNITDDDLLNNTYTYLRANITDSRGVMQTQSEAVERDDPQASTITGEITLLSILSAGRKMGGIGKGVGNIFLQVLGVYFDPVIIAGIGVLILIAVIIYIYVLIKVGG